MRFERCQGGANGAKVGDHGQSHWLRVLVEDTTLNFSSQVWSCLNNPGWWSIDLQGYSAVEAFIKSIRLIRPRLQLLDSLSYVRDRIGSPNLIDQSDKTSRACTVRNDRLFVRCRCFSLCTIFRPCNCIVNLLLNGLVGPSLLERASTSASPSSMKSSLLTFQILVLPLAMAEGRNDRYPLTSPRRSFSKSRVVNQKARQPPY